MPTRPAIKSKRISRKRRKAFVKYSIITILLFASIVFLGGVSFYKNLTKPFASAESITSNDFNGSEVVTFSMIFVKDLQARPLEVESIYFVFLDKLKSKIVSYEIPVNLKTEIPGKFGVEEFGKILSLGMISSDNVSSGANLLNRSLSRKFAFRADKYLVADQTLKTPLVDQFIHGDGKGMLNYDNLLRFASELETNVTLSEFYNILSFVRALPKDKFISIANPESLLSKEKSLDLITREMTFDSSVSLEKSSVAVLNGSGISGVASFGERVISNVGGYVITSENASQYYEESVLITDSYDFEVVKEIISFFGVERVILKGKGGVSENIVDRVDVTLIIGLDVAESL